MFKKKEKIHAFQIMLTKKRYNDNSNFLRKLIISYEEKNKEGPRLEL